MSLLQIDSDSVSDLHKDARGYRPSQEWWAEWMAMDDAEKQRTWDTLIERMNERNAEEEAHEQAAIKAFERTVKTTIEGGAVTRARAIQWLVDAADVRGDFEYFEYTMGLPYGYLAKKATV